MSNCWPTREDCLEAETRRAGLQVAEYKDSIHDVSGLVQFLYGHDTCGEDPDREAQKAARERAMELLGIVLPV